MALGLLARPLQRRVRLHHVPLGRLGGIVGASWNRSEFDKFGRGDTSSRTTTTPTVGAYVFEQAELGRWNLSAGARYDYRRLDVEDDAELGTGTLAQRRTYNSVTGNFGDCCTGSPNRWRWC